VTLSVGRLGGRSLDPTPRSSNDVSSPPPAERLRLTPVTLQRRVQRHVHVPSCRRPKPTDRVALPVMHVLIAAPPFNERDNIELFLTGVREAAPDATVLVVDDNSPDGTGDLAEEL